MGVRMSRLTSIYQQPGDAKNPYFAQYSVVVSEDAPVNASNTTMKNNMPIKNKLNPLKANFNAFLIELFLVIEDNIIIT
jgi:hypothetical protein